MTGQGSEVGRCVAATEAQSHRVGVRHGGIGISAVAAEPADSDRVVVSAKEFIAAVKRSR